MAVQRDKVVEILATDFTVQRSLLVSVVRDLVTEIEFDYLFIPTGRISIRFFQKIASRKSLGGYSAVTSDMGKGQYPEPTTFFCECWLLSMGP